MKKTASMFLAALMILSLAACSDNGTTTTPAPGGSNKDNATTTAPKNNNTTTKTTSGNTTSDPTVNPPTPEFPDLVLVAMNSTFKYKVFSCPYSSSGPNGTYDPDELKDFMDSYGWEMGAEAIPDDAVAAIEAFTDSAEGPFGIDMNGGYEAGGLADADGNPLSCNPEVDWKGDNHGLICSTTFEVEDLEKLKNNYDVYLYFWYDNTPSVYINGKLAFYYNTDCTGNPGDWVDSPVIVDPDSLEVESIVDLLVEGTNTVTIVMKDAWGGRYCAFELDAEPV